MEFMIVFSIVYYCHWLVVVEFGVARPLSFGEGEREPERLLTIFVDKVVKHCELPGLNGAIALSFHWGMSMVWRVSDWIFFEGILTPINKVLVSILYE